MICFANFNIDFKGIVMNCYQVMLDHNGVSKGSGFVAFSSPDEAARAVNFLFINSFLSSISKYDIELELIFIFPMYSLVKSNERKD